MNALPDGKWALDPNATRLEVSVKNFGFRTVVGTLEVTGGSIEIADGDVVSVAVDADAASYASGNAKRDEHVISADFVDAAAHPTIRFTATTATATNSGYQLNGAAHVKGAETPLTLDVRNLEHTGGSASFSASGVIDRNAIGVDKMPSLMIGNDLSLTITATARPTT